MPIHNGLASLLRRRGSCASGQWEQELGGQAVQTPRLLARAPRTGRKPHLSEFRSEMAAKAVNWAREVLEVFRGEVEEEERKKSKEKEETRLREMWNVSRARAADNGSRV